MTCDIDQIEQTTYLRSGIHVEPLVRPPLSLILTQQKEDIEASMATLEKPVPNQKVAPAGLEGAIVYAVVPASADEGQAAMVDVSHTETAVDTAATVGDHISCPSKIEGPLLASAADEAVSGETEVKNLEETSAVVVAESAPVLGGSVLVTTEAPSVAIVENETDEPAGMGLAEEPHTAATTDISTEGPVLVVPLEAPVAAVGGGEIEPANEVEAGDISSVCCVDNVVLQTFVDPDGVATYNIHTRTIFTGASYLLEPHERRCGYLTLLGRASRARIALGSGTHREILQVE